MKYHQAYFALVPHFYEKQLEHTDSEIVPKLLKHINAHRQLLKAQMAILITTLQPLYTNILVLQKETGGILDVTSTLSALRSDFSDLGAGRFPEDVRKTIQTINAAGI